MRPASWPPASSSAPPWPPLWPASSGAPSCSTPGVGRWPGTVAHGVPGGWLDAVPAVLEGEGPGSRGTPRRAGLGSVACAALLRGATSKVCGRAVASRAGCPGSRCSTSRPLTAGGARRGAGPPAVSSAPAQAAGARRGVVLCPEGVPGRGGDLVPWLFAPRCRRIVGTANAVAAGWGNSAGGFVQLLMPALLAVSPLAMAAGVGVFESVCVCVGGGRGPAANARGPARGVCYFRHACRSEPNAAAVWWGRLCWPLTLPRTPLSSLAPSPSPPTLCTGHGAFAARLRRLARLLLRCGLAAGPGRRAGEALRAMRPCRSACRAPRAAPRAGSVAPCFAARTAPSPLCLTLWTASSPHWGPGTATAPCPAAMHRALHRLQVLACGQDLPGGNYATLRRRGDMIHPNTAREYWAACKNYRTWILVRVGLTRSGAVAQPCPPACLAVCGGLTAPAPPCAVLLLWILLWHGTDHEQW